FLPPPAPLQPAPLSLPDALPISRPPPRPPPAARRSSRSAVAAPWRPPRVRPAPPRPGAAPPAPARPRPARPSSRRRVRPGAPACAGPAPRSEEHTSELQSRENLVCCLLLEKKNIYNISQYSSIILIIL